MVVGVPVPEATVLSLPGYPEPVVGVTVREPVGVGEREPVGVGEREPLGVGVRVAFHVGVGLR